MSTESGITTGQAVGAMDAIAALSKIGSKDSALRKRLAQMLIWCKKASEEFFAQRDTLTSTWAERDAVNGEIVLITSPDGKGQMPKMRNGVEFQLEVNKLLREPVKSDKPAPEPFTWEELNEKFLKPADAVLIAQLGPFASISDGA